MDVELRGLTKRFGPVVANDNVNLMIRGGEVLGLLGENGAGKSTMMNMLSGLYTPDAGEILIEVEAVDEVSHGRQRVGHLAVQLVLLAYCAACVDRPPDHLLHPDRTPGGRSEAGAGQRGRGFGGGVHAAAVGRRL